MYQQIILDKPPVRVFNVPTLNKEVVMENTEWSASPCPLDPDNFWQDDETGERVNAVTGERRPYTKQELQQIEAINA
jgi:hypothetical protein